MKKTLCTMLVFMLLIMSEDSCKKDAKATPSSPPQYSIDFTLSAGTVPLVPGPSNVAAAPLRYFLTTLQYYMGYTRLEKADGTEVPLSNLFLVEYNAGSSVAPAPNAIFNTQFNFSIPAGSYTGIKFGIGVPPQILDTLKHWHYAYNILLDPLDVEYGMPWTMYPNVYNIIRDIAIDMTADTSKAQNQTVNREYSFHLLNDQDTVNLYYEMVLPDVFTVVNGDNHNVTINLDYNNVFFNSSNPINLRTSVGTDMDSNDSTGIVLGEKINRNIHNSLTLKQN